MIGVFGDSIAFGENDTKGGWANRLKKDFEIKNKSLCGEDTVGLLHRFKQDLDETNPNIIIIALGINDSASVLKKNRVPLDLFKENYNLIIKISKKYTNKIICIGLTRVDEKKVCPIPWDSIYYWNKDAEMYDNTIKEIAKKENIIYVKMKDVVLLENLDDGLHPNSIGHEKIYKIIKKELLKLSKS